ncbi:glycosyltransferase family 4 protein [Candidatus Woesearchaeota archaeon]|nr:glycosyltransferase family 4 protein [Candidatus Woesearchaeota archaeon]
MQPIHDHGTGRPRLLIATDNFVPRWDGIARFLLEIIPRLRSRYDITVVAPRIEDKTDEHLAELEGVTVHRIDRFGFRVGDFRPARFQAGKVRTAVRQADIVFTQTMGPIGMMAIHHSHRMRKNLVAYVHSIEWRLVVKSLSRRNPLRRPFHLLAKWLVARMYRRCDFIIVPYHELAELLSWEKVGAKKRVACLGIDTRRFRPPASRAEAKRAIGINPDTTVIGYCGRIGREKNLVTLLRAFLRLRTRKEGIVLAIVGEGVGGYERHFEARKDIIFFGDQDDVVPYLQAIDIYVLPSLTETTSLSTLEAMACGCAVASTPVGYVKTYLKEKENGIFFPFENPLVLSLKLEWLIDSPDVRQALGMAARRTIVERFDWDTTVRRIMRVFDEFPVLKKSGDPDGSLRS